MKLDEIPLIGKWISNFTNLKLSSIKRIHTKSFENFDVIMTCDFYQVQQVRDTRVFKTNKNNIDSVAPIFGWKFSNATNLKQIMCQSDQLFIDIFYHFQTTSQSQGDVDFRNHLRLRTPPNDSIFSL